MDKVISSPLTYWGGKYWLFKKVWELIPDSETEIFSPFLGGGSIEINLAYRGYTVHAYDNYAPLVNFWQQWLDNPESVKHAAYEILALYDRQSLRMKLKWQVGSLTEGLESASFLYIFNQLQFNGKFRASRDSHLREYFLRGDGEYVQRLDQRPLGTPIFRNFDFWQSKPLSSLNIQHADFEQVFWIHQHQFAYIDPPYFGNEKGYGGSQNGFNHEKLRELVSGRPKTAISYNDHPKARKLYEGFHIQPIKRGSDGKQELLILSPDIAARQLYLF